jgi:hypothetical protein
MKAQTNSDEERGKIIMALGKAEKMFMFPDAFENWFLRME